MYRPTDTRREFLEKLGFSAAGLVAAGYSATAAGYQANEQINIGCIGTGGRCRRLMQSLQGIDGVRIAAVCDVWDANLEEGRKLADENALASKDYHEILARKDIDAVVVGTPDHWHAQITIDACAAGKDVYVEKPLTHSLEEGQAVIDAQNSHQRIVQVGMQQRSMPHIQKAREIIAKGGIGEIHKIHLTWNRNQPRGKKESYGIDPSSVHWKRFLGSARSQPFDEYRFRNWRWFWDFGGGIFTDLMVHWIDVAHWLAELEHPATAVSIGDHYNSQGVWETPDTVQTLLDYSDRKVQAYFEGTFSSARNGAMIEFMGTDATLYIDRGRYEVHPERLKRVNYSELVLSSEPSFRGADFYDQPDGETLHLGNWLECIRTREKPTAPAEAGVSAAGAAHLANIALRGQQTAKWVE